MIKMNISTKGRYGLRAMIELALRYEEGPLSLREIADSQQISYKYLEQLVPSLKAEGLIESYQGSKGGYSLKKAPDEISALEVVKALDGSLAPVECVEDPKLCDRYSFCATQELWNEINESLRKLLRSKTLKQLAKKKKDKINI